MCFAGIETEIHKLPERELPASPKPADPDRTEPRTFRLHPSRPLEPLPATSDPIPSSRQIQPA